MGHNCLNFYVLSLKVGLPVSSAPKAGTVGKPRLKIFPMLQSIHDSESCDIKSAMIDPKQ